MNRFSIPFSLLFALIAVWTFATTGCYEGYKKPNNGNEGGNGKTGGGAGTKPYGFTLIDVIKPSAEALVSNRCGRVPTSLAAIRMAEIEARARSVAEYLNTISDFVVVVASELDVSDCETFGLLRSAANRPLPEGAASRELSVKPALHVRLVLWYGDSSRTYPAYEVYGGEWQSFRDLKNLGFQRRISVNHFALTGPVFGYIWNWKNASDQNLNFTAKTISDLSPTPEGIRELKRAGLESTIEFGSWLQQRGGTL